jgi:plasmid maintenance system antidote protein VapI
MTDPPKPKIGHMPMTPGTPLADRIQALGYMLKDVAEGTGINRWRLNDYLNRRRRIMPRDRQRLTEFLHCEPEALGD